MFWGLVPVEGWWIVLVAALFNLAAGWMILASKGESQLKGLAFLGFGVFLLVAVVDIFV